jgi:hypothetical protein
MNCSVTPNRVRASFLWVGGGWLFGPLLAAQPAPGPAIPPTVEPPDARAYVQQVYAPASVLVPPEKAKQIVDAFRIAYGKLGKPSLLITVNRELGNGNAGLQVAGRREHTVTVSGDGQTTYEADPRAPAAPPASGPPAQVNVVVGSRAGAAAMPPAPGKVTTENHRTVVSSDTTYVPNGRPPPTLADRQMVRDIERFFGRPLRAGGARLADQQVAEDLMAAKPIGHFTADNDDAARRDRAALAQVADVVIEVLISSHDLAVPTLGGPDRIVAVPDIQATAIRLKDAAIIGQVAASDVLGRKWQAARVASQFDVNDIAEATALALMEDITLTGSP